MRSFILLLTLTVTSWGGVPARIVSIGGANTETIFALGCASSIVGVDSTSTFPAEAAKLPQVGYQRTLSAEGIASLEPDLVILPATAGPPAAIAQLRTLGIPLLQLEEGFSIEATAARIHAIGKSLGREEAAQKLVADLQKSCEDVSRPAVPTPGVLFVMSAGGRAPMVAGTETAADAVIRLAGGRNVVADFTGYKQLSPEALVLLNPDIILTTSRTMETAGPGSNPSALLPGLELTTAGRNRRVIVMDDLLLLGFGPRTGEALLELSRCLFDGQLRAGR